MSGEEPQRARARLSGKRRAGARADEVERAPLVPLILVPSPADLAAGRRVITAEEDEIPRAARLFRDRAEAAGWTTQVTYSHFWDVPPATGAWAGRWVPKHSMFVRFWHLGRRLRGYAGWTCVDDGTGAARWSSGGGQVQILGYRWPAGVASGGVKQLEKLVSGEQTVKQAPVCTKTDKRGLVMIHYGFTIA